MAYLRLRRILELAVLDRPGLQWLLAGRGGEAERRAPADYWEGLHSQGTYSSLMDDRRRDHLRLLAAMVAERAPQGRVLEIGCGQGAFYETLRSHRPGRYVGVDIAPSAIEQAKARFADDIAAGHAAFEAGDGAAMGLERGYDAIVFADSIEYLGSMDEVLARFTPLLAPGGFLCATQWLAAHPIRLWNRNLKPRLELLDEALVCAPWGGAWQVWAGRPKSAPP
jgi:predicted TPR repeat methyltransferase